MTAVRLPSDYSLAPGGDPLDIVPTAAPPRPARHGRRWPQIALKWAASAAILVYLLRYVGPGMWSTFGGQPLGWPYLAAGVILCGSAVCVTQVRWGILVRTLGIELTTGQALRIGLVGYLSNFLTPLGVTGGDGIKAAALAWRHASGVGRAAASVLVDRVLGLYTLFLVASAAICLSGFPPVDSPLLHAVSRSALGATGVATLLGAAMLLVPQGWTRPVRIVGRIPIAGPFLRQLLDALLLYRRRTRILAIATAMSIGVQLLFASGVYCIAQGLPGPTHPYVRHLVILPLSAAASAVPLPVGPMEWVLENLYTALPLPDGGNVPAGRGLLIALGYRSAVILAAAVVLACCWLAARGRSCQKLTVDG